MIHRLRCSQAALEYMAAYGEIETRRLVSCQGCIPHEVEEVYWSAAGECIVHLATSRMHPSWDPDGPAPGHIKVYAELPPDLSMGARAVFLISVDGRADEVVVDSTIVGVAIHRLCHATLHSVKLGGFRDQWDFRAAWNVNEPEWPWQQNPWAWVVQYKIADRGLLAAALGPAAPG